MISVKRSGHMVLLSWTNTPYVWAMRPSVAMALESQLSDLLKMPMGMFPKACILDDGLPPIGVDKRYDGVSAGSGVVARPVYSFSWVRAAQQVVKAELGEPELKSLISQIRKASQSPVVLSSTGDEFV
ncbi:MAG: hypothetical protein WC565_03440 [Parcubacteria group bacterium]